MVNMKRFGNYQHLDNEPMTERDKTEVDSKFWNKGKWDNFVVPFLPEDCSELILIDMGCNAGLFLKLAKDRGFNRAIGVDGNKEAVKRGLVYRNKIKGDYDIQCRYMERSLIHLPVADYTLLVNSHYYFAIQDWLEYLDKLQSQTHYCIIVTTLRQRKYCRASADIEDINRYFNHWKKVGVISPLSLQDDPRPRHLWSLCFESPCIERVPIDSLDCGNHVQGAYYEEIEKGVDPLKTRYFKILKKYRNKTKGWSKETLEKFMYGKVALYKDVKKNGLHKAITINAENRILDGNHRYKITRYLGYKSILIRRT